MTLVRWTKGYNQAELAGAQHRFGLVFPPDLVALLREKRPVEGHDWTDDAAIRRALDQPFNALLNSVELGASWWPEWGTRPSSAHAREQILRGAVSLAPKLIPLIGHRYLPEAEPVLASLAQAKSNQVYSILVRPCGALRAEPQPSRVMSALWVICVDSGMTIDVRSAGGAVGMRRPRAGPQRRVAPATRPPQRHSRPGGTPDAARGRGVRLGRQWQAEQADRP
jgi:hypothetical protein